jgi:hypothetical protein
LAAHAFSSSMLSLCPPSIDVDAGRLRALLPSVPSLEEETDRPRLPLFPLKSLMVATASGSNRSAGPWGGRILTGKVAVLRGKVTILSPPRTMAIEMLGCARRYSEHRGGAHRVLALRSMSSADTEVSEFRALPAVRRVMGPPRSDVNAFVVASPCGTDSLGVTCAGIVRVRAGTGDKRCRPPGLKLRNFTAFFDASCQVWRSVKDSKFCANMNGR